MLQLLMKTLKLAVLVDVAVADEDTEACSSC
jgi:hypothetical protein